MTIDRDGWFVDVEEDFGKESFIYVIEGVYVDVFGLLYVFVKYVELVWGEDGGVSVFRCFRGETRSFDGVAEIV